MIINKPLASEKKNIYLKREGAKMEFKNGRAGRGGVGRIENGKNHRATKEGGFRDRSFSAIIEGGDSANNQSL